MFASMIRTAGIAVALALLLLACASKATPHPEAAAVAASFEAYRKALSERNGEVAVALVDHNTLAYYQRMLDLARKGDAQTVRSHSTIDKLMVLAIRHRVPVADLATANGKAILARGVTEGWTDKNSLARLQLGPASVTRDIAFAPVLDHGKETPLKFTFRKEATGWKIDLADLMAFSNLALKTQIKRSGADEEAFLLDILESVSSKQVSDRIWEPPLP